MSDATKLIHVGGGRIVDADRASDFWVLAYGGSMEEIDARSNLIVEAVNAYEHVEALVLGAQTALDYYDENIADMTGRIGDEMAGLRKALEAME